MKHRSDNSQAMQLLDLRMEDRTNVRVNVEEDDLGRLERRKVEM